MVKQKKQRAEPDIPYPKQKDRFTPTSSTVPLYASQKKGGSYLNIMLPYSIFCKADKLLSQNKKNPIRTLC